MFFKNTIFKTPYLPIIGMPPSSKIGGSKSPSSPVTGTNPTYLGCYTDSATRAIPNFAPGYGTPAACAAYVASQGGTVFGMEAGSECWWGTDLVAAVAQGPASCGAPCTADTSKNCGGSWALAVYTTM